MSPETCRIVAVGRRRDGGTRYWCLKHQADATAKYGRRASKCRHADLPPVMPDQVLQLNLQSFPGGVAVWGAIAPIYDTTRTIVEHGVHVHARCTSGDDKEIDGTFRRVELRRDRKAGPTIVITETDAVYYTVSSIFGFAVKQVDCPFCGVSHLDKDWFSVHPHRRHLCAGCGKHFRDTERGVGNPAAGVRALLGAKAHRLKKARRSIRLDQAKYPGGIQLWGSNPALLWTARRSEEEGIHVHVVDESGSSILIDETFSRVTIDGVDLDSAMVRTLMAQSALPHISGRVVSLHCPDCGDAHLDSGENAFTPHAEHVCDACGAHFGSRGRMRKTIGNPLLAILGQLGRQAPRPPQDHKSPLLVETI